jgi:asparagine synthase (glutamine-hydrolysing)
MCGIVGVIASRADAPISEARLARMRDSLVYRGPDDAGSYRAPGVALGSRRLAILDLSARGHMPMSTPDGRYWIVYNGEIYNYRELRADLAARGLVFGSNTDTEVILALYVHRGPAMLDSLNGMFAFAIWDSETRTLFLARDRLGVKPLYYAHHAGALYFASEQKALFAAGVPASFDPGTWEELLRFGYVAGERTPFTGVSRLLPGHTLTWKDGRTELRRWWSLAERQQHLRGTASAAEWFRETFDSAVALRRISDVPVGVLLSGGLDSTSVAASLATQAGRGVASFTVRFVDDSYFDEGALARQVAQRWGLQHHEFSVKPTELLNRLRRASWVSDEPLAHQSDLHLGAIAEYAKPLVTVLLSGEGADETLGGYVRYLPLRRPALLDALRRVVPSLARLTGHPRVKKLARMLALGATDRLVLFNTTNIFPDDLAEIGMRPRGEFAFRERVLDEARRVYPREAARQAMYNDLHTFLGSLLHRNDRMTMGASIECRVPFLDYRLVEHLSAMPTSALLRGRRGKKLLLDAVKDRLPDDIVRARKWGFAAPWSRYLREVGELRDIVRDLPDTGVTREGPFDRRALRHMVKEFLGGRDRWMPLVLQLVMIQVWHDSYFAELASGAYHG